MLRLLLLVVITTKVVVSVVNSPNQNFDTSYKDIVDVFSDSVIDGVQFQRIQNVVSNSSSKKYETVRKFLAHYNSLKPVTVLVDDTRESFEDAKIFMKRVFEVTPNAKFIPFSFQKFNSSSVSSPVQISHEKTFEALLEYNQIQGLPYLDPTEGNGTAVFFAVLNAANTLPQDSAILTFLDRKIADEDLTPHINLIKKKNIKVYVVWGGSYPNKQNDEHLLRQLCKYSNGLFLVNSAKDFSDYYYRQFLSDTSLYNTSIILSKNNLYGQTDLTFPIDKDVTGIHVRITPFVSNGSLSTPKGQVMDVLKKEEIADYSSGSFGFADTGLHVVHLNMTTAPTRDVGIWRLSLGNALALYNVTVFAYTKLGARAYFAENDTRFVDPSVPRTVPHSSSITYFNGLLIGSVLGHHGSAGSSRKVMKLGISAFITSITNIGFVDKDGQSITDNAKYTLVKDSLTENNVSHHDREIDVEVYDVEEKPAYAVIQGVDSEGNDFSRLAYVSSYSSSDIFPQPTLTIEVGTSSELITTGGKFPVILFEVTNHKSTAVDVRFTCKDEKSILRFLQPYRRIISPQETVTVRLTLITRFGSYEDEITFTAWIGSESFKKKVIVDVGSQVLSDNENPDLDYSFSSDCSKVVFSKCSEGTWTVKITAKDSGSGLLQVTSYPRGLYFPNGFTTGTKEAVTGYYSDSCCSPDLQITAVDRLNNRRVVNVNSYLSYWGPAQIAALVLGILIFILIIVLIIYFVRRCIHKRENYNLPTYRGGRI